MGTKLYGDLEMEFSVSFFTLASHTWAKRTVTVLSTVHSRW